LQEVSRFVDQNPVSQANPSFWGKLLHELLPLFFVYFMLVSFYLLYIMFYQMNKQDGKKRQELRKTAWSLGTFWR